MFSTGRGGAGHHTGHTLSPMCLTGETECQPGECPCKIKEVLRLRFELQLGQREIARACSISQGAVHNYLKKAAAAGIGWPLPEDWDEKRIEETLFGDRHPIERRQRALPDFPALHEQFQQHRHLTLQLAWEEYRQVHPDGYGYAFASSTKVGDSNWMWCCGKSTWRGKSSLSITPGQPFPSRIRKAGRSAQPRSS